MVYAQNKRQQVWSYISIQSRDLQNHTVCLPKVEMTEEWAKKYPKIHFSVMHPGWADTPAVRLVFWNILEVHPVIRISL